MLKCLLHLLKRLPLLLFIILVNAVFCNPSGFLQSCDYAWIYEPKTWAACTNENLSFCGIFAPSSLGNKWSVQLLHLLVLHLLPSSIIIIGSPNLHFVMIPSSSVSLYFTPVFFVEENLFIVLRAVELKRTYWSWTPTCAPLMVIIVSTTLSWTKIFYRRPLFE